MVSIKRSGNILSVTPSCEKILEDCLSYTHRTMSFDYGRPDKRQVDVSERSLYKIEGDSLFTTQGALHRITTTLAKAGIQYTYEDMRKVTHIEPDYDYLKMSMPALEFRLKQDEILANLIARDCGIIIAPTAFGKTFIMLALCALYPKSNIIIASPSTALLRGTYRRVLAITPQVGRVGGGQHDGKQRVTLTTFASLMNTNFEKCDILLLDEVHKAAAGETSKMIARIRSPVKIFGMTATPKGRSDGAELATEVLVGPIIYRVGYDEAAVKGLVSRIKVAALDIPESSCSVFSYNYSTRVAKKRNCYWTNEVRNNVFAEAIRDCVTRYKVNENPQILALVETVTHAFELASRLPDFTVVYAGMNPVQQKKLASKGLLPVNFKPLTASQRDVLLKDFEDGKLRKVVATGCWGEGVDFVHLDVVANLSGSPSKISTVQWAGRNSRMHEGKNFGLLIDSLDQWDKWAHSRAQERLRTYKANNWEIIRNQ